MAAKKVAVCRAADVAPGQRRVVKVGARSIGVFNVGGRFYALLNICPHHGANLCDGPVGGTNLPTDNYEYNYGRDGEVLRCARHGWEFDIATGENLDDPSVRAKTYPVTVEDGEVVVHV